MKIRLLAVTKSPFHLIFKLLGTTWTHSLSHELLWVFAFNYYHVIKKNILVIIYTLVSTLFKYKVLSLNRRLYLWKTFLPKKKRQLKAPLQAMTGQKISRYFHLLKTSKCSLFRQVCCKCFKSAVLIVLKKIGIIFVVPLITFFNILKTEKYTKIDRLGIYIPNVF